MNLDTFRVSDSALLIRFGKRIDVALSRSIARLAQQMPGDGIVDLVPSYTTLLIQFDPRVIGTDEIIARLDRLWNAGDIDPAPVRTPVDIPVVYGGRHGPDLDLVARHAGISSSEVIHQHSNAEYVVGAVGFSPGFGYLIGLPEDLATPRLKTPRIRVPAGSVAIGGGQTAVYPVETAGGWNLIGRTATPMFDPDADDPFLLRTGDVVRFRPVDRLDISAGPVRPAQHQPRVGGIEVLQPGLLTTIQDHGRFGLGAFGISPNGAADGAALSIGNYLVGNEADAAGLEMTLTGPTLRFRQGATFAVTGEGPTPFLNDRPIESNRSHQAFLGDTLSFEPAGATMGARGYLCIGGGIDTPLVMGSRSTDLVAGIGGLDGRALRSGDVHPIGTRHGAPRLLPWQRPRDRRVIRIQAGPQRSMFDNATWYRMITRPFTVTNDANRVGIRLSGPSLLPRDRQDIISEGVVTGSVQVTGSGQPIVLLPGRATIGGYPKIATVIDDDLGLLGQLRPGDVIRFQESG